MKLEFIGIRPSFDLLHSIKYKRGEKIVSVSVESSFVKDFGEDEVVKRVMNTLRLQEEKKACHLYIQGSTK